MEFKKYQSWCTQFIQRLKITASAEKFNFNSFHAAHIQLVHFLSVSTFSWVVLRSIILNLLNYLWDPPADDSSYFFPSSSPFRCCSSFHMSFRRKASFHMIPVTAFLLSFLQFIFFTIMFSRMKERYRFLPNKEIYNKNRKLRWH